MQKQGYSIKRLFFKTLFLAVLIIGSSCENNNPHALIITETGTIEIELYIDKAPVTVSNFMQYCIDGRYKNASFYRSVRGDNQPNSEIKIEILQGGLKEDNHPNMLRPIKHESTLETGILHSDGTISMARYEPGTATSEFFICIGDQPELDFDGKRNPDGQGFAAFGKVVKGMDAVKKYWQLPTKEQYLEPPVKILDIILID
mgnify:CR=1 FL=1